MPSLNTKLAALVALIAIASPTLTVSLLTLSPASPTLAQISNAREAEANQLLEKADQLIKVGNHKDAIEVLEKSLRIFQDIGDRRYQAAVLVLMGQSYDALKQPIKSVEVYQQAFALIKEYEKISVHAYILIRIGKAYDSLEQQDKAIEFYQQALAISSDVGDHDRKVQSLVGLGRVKLHLKQYTKAIEFLQHALAIYKDLGKREEQAIVLIGLSPAHIALEQYDEAIGVLQQALTIYKDLGDQNKQAAVLLVLGSTHKALGHYAEALAALEQSFSIIKSDPKNANSEQQFTVLIFLVLLHSQLGSYAKMADLCQQALIIASKNKDRNAEATVLTLLGASYSGIGEYAKALEYLQKANVIAKEIGNRRIEVSALGGLGQVYSQLGQDTKALEFYQRTLAIYEEQKKVGDPKEQANTLDNLGDSYAATKQFEKAVESYQQALAIYKNTDHPNAQAGILNDLGKVYSQIDQNTKALDFYDQSLSLYRKIGNRNGQLNVLNRLGLIYVALGEHKKAIKAFEEAFAISKASGSRSEEGGILTVFGVYSLNSKKFAEAEKLLFDAVAIWESLRPGLADENKVSLFEKQTVTYLLLQGALILQKKTEAALEIAERGRARAFVELLAKRVSSQSATANNQSMMKPPNIQQIRQVARDQNATLVQYTVFPEDIGIWVIKPSGEVIFREVNLKSASNSSLTQLTLKQLNEEQSELTQNIVSTRRSLGVVPANSQNTGTLDFQADPSEMSRQLKQLHRLLIEPIADLLPTDPDQPVIFIPQGALFLVPFPALRDANNKYLIEKHTILTASSIQVLDLTRQQKNKVTGSQTALIVGNPVMPKGLAPLPHAATEAKAIAALFQTQPLLGAQASKATVMQKMPQARLIHLATHGSFNDARGLGSAIALTPSGKDDGWLTAEEILAMKLNADLVVLSACDTGRGRITGDGVIGLSRSLIAAGTPSVMVSLWSVSDDSTAILMTEFYQNLKRHPNKARALRQAMLSTKKSRPNPIDWAAFTLIGEAE